MPPKKTTFGTGPSGFKGGLLPPRYAEAMQGPHPKPGECYLNRVREFQEKATQFEQELIAAGRSPQDADRECLDLAQAHLDILAERDPENFAFTRMRDWAGKEKPARQGWLSDAWKM
jgi:hypothetical protein